MGNLEGGSGTPGEGAEEADLLEMEFGGQASFFDTLPPPRGATTAMSGKGGTDLREIKGGSLGGVEEVLHVLRTAVETEGNRGGNESRG